jgi:hypothetical protein
MKQGTVDVDQFIFLMLASYGMYIVIIGRYKSTQRHICPVKGYGQICHKTGSKEWHDVQSCRRQRQGNMHISGLCERVFMLERDRECKDQ